MSWRTEYTERQGEKLNKGQRAEKADHHENKEIETQKEKNNNYIKRKGF